MWHFVVGQYLLKLRMSFSYYIISGLFLHLQGWLTAGWSIHVNQHRSRNYSLHYWQECSSTRMLHWTVSVKKLLIRWTYTVHILQWLIGWFLDWYKQVQMIIQKTWGSLLAGTVLHSCCRLWIVKQKWVLGQEQQQSNHRVQY